MTSVLAHCSRRASLRGPRLRPLRAADRGCIRVYQVYRRIQLIHPSLLFCAGSVTGSVTGSVSRMGGRSGRFVENDARSPWDGRPNSTKRPNRRPIHRGASGLYARKIGLYPPGNRSVPPREPFCTPGGSRLYPREPVLYPPFSALYGGVRSLYAFRQGWEWEEG
jgi:hypothetical protein